MVNTIILTRERLSDDLKDDFDKIISKLNEVSIKTGIKKHYLILQWLLEGAKNG